MGDGIDHVELATNRWGKIRLDNNHNCIRGNSQNR